MMEAAKKREESKNKKLNLMKSATIQCVNGLSEEIMFTLTNLGFKVEQIMAAHSKYKFTKVEEALTLMTKDQETNLFHHEYSPDRAKQQCLICEGKENEHFDRIEYPVDNQIKKQIQDYLKSHRKEEGNNDNNNKNHKNNEFNDKSENSKNRLLLIEKKIDISKLNENYDEFLCPICFANSIKDKGSYFALSGCHHKICIECIRNFLKINIKEGNISKLTCLYGGCNIVYPHEIVKEFTSSDDWNNYKKYTRNNERTKVMQNNPNIIHCPYPDCTELIELHNMQFGMMLPEHFVYCNQEHSFCLRCRVLEQNHDQASCEGSNERLLREINDISKNKSKSKKLNYKQCPCCKIIIEKVEGCNKMRCLNCDYEFCWLCMQEYEGDHYAIYNFSGCPGLEHGK